eukprot:TRINITY_DN23849_c0_g1_i5.p1 TRINITY_DN23849_c0_g1~~TRINITY_DN23849_c0_g1_i5.p1  ORF type:complete len:476 (+),score=132.22 TRINITY_DN23849_c0_g1_i5:55-1428(+)
MVNYPVLGPKLKTYVINLARRPDRREHIEGLCRDLDLDYEVVEAVDGRALSQLDDARLENAVSGEIVEAAEKRRSCQEVARDVPLGFRGLKTNLYRATWTTTSASGERQLQMQFLRMAAHRLDATELTGFGHELWGAVGCSRSHQAVLKRALADATLEWALVLEDDAWATEPLKELAETFRREMQFIAKTEPQWGLVYLGGHVSSSVSTKEKLDMMLNSRIAVARCVYQTHAFIVRRSVMPKMLRLLERGYAADAALSSWSKQPDAAGRTFLFSPPLLKQPGGTDRWKDSDIFVEGAFFQRSVAKSMGKDYTFDAVTAKRCASQAARQSSMSEEAPTPSAEAPTPSAEVNELAALDAAADASPGRVKRKASSESTEPPRKKQQKLQQPSRKPLVGEDEALGEGKEARSAAFAACPDEATREEKMTTMSLLSVAALRAKARACGVSPRQLLGCLEKAE